MIKNIALKEALSKYDNSDKNSFSEFEVRSTVEKLDKSENEEEHAEAVSEYVAFALSENYKGDHGNWGTYYGPMMVAVAEDGTVYESPQLNAITPEMIKYWEGRSVEAQNAILKSRYSGLVWDFAKKVTEKAPNVEIADRYINSLIEIGERRMHRHDFESFHKLERALNIALLLNKKELVERVKHTILNLEKQITEDDKPGLWGYSFDLLMDRKVGLTEDEEKEIIAELEARLMRVSTANPKIDPWAAEHAANRLAKYYTKKSKAAEVKRVVLTVGHAYDAIIKEASAIQAHGWLQTVHKLYASHGLKAEAEQILIRMRQVGQKTNDEMGVVQHSMDIPGEKIDEYVDAMLSGKDDEVILKLIAHYIPREKDAKEQLLKSAKDTPFSYLIAQKIQDGKGRILASIGPLEHDLSGHIVRQISQHLVFSSLFLRVVIEKAIEREILSEQSVMSILEQCPAIEKNRLNIIRKGIRSYFEEDYETAIHLLIPQIEEATRNLIELAGGNILKENKSGGYQVKVFEELLRDNTLSQILGDDFCLYFRILFTDQRGWNLRNNVSHGLANPESFNSQTADRIIHALLCVGHVRVKE